MVEYTYDAWGKLLSTTGSMATTLGAHNPLRYRGYVYDNETALYYLQSRYYDPELGRFINADAFASTGQGILGNNMFAYCLNNPINRSDISGSVSIWYYLIVDHDMGFIHRTVQAHILATGGPDIKTELVLTGLGRADVVDISLGTVWEIKHAGQNPEGRTLEAFAQAVGYIGTDQKGVTIYGLGNAGEFEGAFYITCLDYSYSVNYTTPIDGVVLYSVSENMSREIPSEATVYAYNPQKNSNKQNVLGFGYMALGYGAVGFGGGGGVLGKDLTRDFLYCGG